MNKSGGAAVGRFLPRARPLLGGAVGTELRRAFPGPVAATIGSAYIGSRIVVLLAAWFAENLTLVRPVGAGQGGPLLQSLTRWDGNFYLSIARYGYHAEPIAGPYHDYVFFPLYPLLIRLFASPFPDAAPIVAVLISNVAFLAALALLYLLGRQHLDSVDAARAAAILAIFPFGTVFSMAYSESVFLLLTVTAFLAAERGNRRVAGLCLALASLTRPQGVLVTVPLAILFLRQDRWKVRRSILWLAAGPLAFVSYIGFVWSLTGDVAAYGVAQQAWGNFTVSPAAPSVGSVSAVPPLAILILLVVALYIFLFVYVRNDRLAPEYVALPAMFLMAVFLAASFQSAPRYLMLAFPYAWILAERRNHLFRRTWPLISSGLLAGSSLLLFAGAFPP